MKAVRDHWISNSNDEFLEGKCKNVYYLFSYYFLQNNAKRWALTGNQKEYIFYFYYIVDTLKYFIKCPEAFSRNRT